MIQHMCSITISHYSNSCNILSIFFLGTLSECLMVWIQIMTGILWVLIWVQTAYKGYPQVTKVAASKESVKPMILYSVGKVHFWIS